MSDSRNKGFELLMAQKYEEALLSFQDVTKDVSKYYPKAEKKYNLAHQAYCYKKLKNYDKALELFDEALRIDDDLTFARENKADLLNEYGTQLFDEGKYAAALEKFLALIKYCPRSRVYEEAGDCYKNLQKYDKAIEMYNKALKDDPHSSSAMTKKIPLIIEQGQILFNHGNYLEAAKKLQTAICVNIDPLEKKRCLVNIGLCFRNLKDYTKAHKKFDAALKIDSNYDFAIYKKADTLNDQGVELMNDQKYVTAIKLFTEACDITTDWERKQEYLRNVKNCILAMKSLADEDFNAGHFDRALVRYEKLLKFIETDEEMKTEVANCIEKTLIEIEALKVYRQGLEKLEKMENIGQVIFEFETAVSKSRNETQKKLYQNARDKVLSKIDSMKNLHLNLTWAPMIVDKTQDE